MKQRTIKLAIPAGEPPTEICLFKRGENETTKGTFLFDDEAAASVMAEYRAHGIDLCFDYGHSMVDGTGLDPAEAGRAAGWFNLEVRDGALWAVNIRWTDPAAEAIRRKEWRFFSPAFNADKDGRVRSLLNVAVTNLPATRKLQPLIAASKGTTMRKSKHTSLSTLDPDTAKKALDALIAGDTEACAEILREVVERAATGDAAPPADAPAEDDAPPDASPPTEDVAASRTLLALTGTTSLTAVAAEVKRLQRDNQQLTAAVDEHVAAQRIALCRKLVTHAGKTPASVWAEAEQGKSPIPKAIYQRMTLSELTEHVEAEINALPPGQRPRLVNPAHMAITPPVSLSATKTPDGGKIVRASYGDVHLAAREVRMFENTPEGQARMKAYVETSFVRRRHEERQAENGGAQ